MKAICIGTFLWIANAFPAFKVGRNKLSSRRILDPERSYEVRRNICLQCQSNPRPETNRILQLGNCAESVYSNISVQCGREFRRFLRLLWLNDQPPSFKQQDPYRVHLGWYQCIASYSLAKQQCVDECSVANQFLCDSMLLAQASHLPPGTRLAHTVT